MEGRFAESEALRTWNWLSASSKHKDRNSGADPISDLVNERVLSRAQQFREFSLLAGRSPGQKDSKIGTYTSPTSIEFRSGNPGQGNFEARENYRRFE